MEKRINRGALSFNATAYISSFVVFPISASRSIASPKVSGMVVLIRTLMNKNSIPGIYHQPYFFRNGFSILSPHQHKIKSFTIFNISITYFSRFATTAQHKKCLWNYSISIFIIHYRYSDPHKRDMPLCPRSNGFQCRYPA